MPNTWSVARVICSGRESAIRPEGEFCRCSTSTTLGETTATSRPRGSSSYVSRVKNRNCRLMLVARRRLKPVLYREVILGSSSWRGLPVQMEFFDDAADGADCTRRRFGIGAQRSQHRLRPFRPGWRRRKGEGRRFLRWQRTAVGNGRRSGDSVARSARWTGQVGLSRQRRKPERGGDRGRDG